MVFVLRDRVCEDFMSNEVWSHEENCKINFFTVIDVIVILRAYDYV